jgi:hypothetical protein
MEYRPEQALVDALIDTINFELCAQLALADAGLDLEEIKSVATMVADQVLTEFYVTPRTPGPVLG